MSSAMNINKAADQCVMCGMCLPHCPTYKISQHEAESPRGRISLIKAYSEQDLQSSEALHSHLHSCTTCLKCEQVCPANVPYEELIDQGRALYRKELSLITRLLQSITISMLTTKWGHRIISLARNMTRCLPAKFHLVQLLRFASYKSSLSNHGDHSKSITVLPGCTGNIFDQQTLDSVTKILGTLGYDTKCPDEILCCGALAQHSGLPEIASTQIQATKNYLNNSESNEYISFASGCGRQYNKCLSTPETQHYDILSWLLNNNKTKSLKINSLSEHVLIHIPCTVEQQNIDLCEQVINLIPNIKVSMFNDGLSCCGAGGAQLLSPQDSNQSLLNTKVHAIKSLQPDMIVSSNIGCAMHLKTGLAKAGLDIEVIHPVTLLSRQLRH